MRDDDQMISMKIKIIQKSIQGLHNAIFINRDPLEEERLTKRIIEEEQILSGMKKEYPEYFV